MALIVNGEHVDDRTLLEAFAALSGGRLPHELRDSTPEQVALRQRAAEQHAVRSVLLDQLARQAQFAPTQQDVDAERRRQWGSAANQTCGAGVSRQIETALRVGNMVRHVTRHVPRPGRREVEAYYASHRGQFEQPEQVDAAHIVQFAGSAAELAEGRSILLIAEAELAGGEPFHRVAERYSDCKGTGGSIGWVRRGDMAEAFEQVVFALPKGVCSPIFETVFGVHIALVSARKLAGLQPFDAVRQELSKRMHETCKQAVVDGMVTQAMREARIEVADGAVRGVPQGEKKV